MSAVEAGVASWSSDDAPAAPELCKPLGSSAEVGGGEAR
jgi:hypothetical protein